MKVFYALVPIFIACFICVGLADSVSAETEIPSVDEIFTGNIDYPPYSVGTFFEDMTLLFTDFDLSSFKLSDFGNFIVNDTFIGDISDGSVSVETITDSWVNVFFIACIIICVLCVVSAILAGKKYKRISE
ncbi:MAG: hypothetical protein WC248_01780 [Candidatus Methanomethylophilaceae archaeon]|jgi:hypothetical protein